MAVVHRHWENLPLEIKGVAKELNKKLAGNFYSHFKRSLTQFSVFSAYWGHVVITIKLS